MILGTHIKQPADTKDYDIHYDEWLTLNDSVESAVVTPDSADLIIDSVFINGDVIKIWISGGIAGITYKVTVTMTTADGRIQQDEFKMKIKEY